MRISRGDTKVIGGGAPWHTPKGTVTGGGPVLEHSKRWYGAGSRDKPLCHLLPTPLIASVKELSVTFNDNKAGGEVLAVEE